MEAQSLKMPELNSVLISVLAVFLIHYLYRQYVESTKDVNELYLSEQSRIEAVREKSESAIYKSNKLDLASGGLRVGLEVRYNYYKSRSGNLSDVWEVLMNHVKLEKNRDSSITINDKSISILRLNYAISQFSTYLKDGDIQIIKLPLHSVSQLDFDAFVIMFSGFINQITVELYDDVSHTDDSAKALLITWNDTSDDELYFNVNNQHVYDLESEEVCDVYSNEYTFLKDRGIALKVVRKAEHSGHPNMVTNIEFTQLNIVSAVASTLKHLPMTQELNEQDRVVIVQSQSSNVDIFNKLVKILSTFLSHSKLILIDHPTELQQLIVDHDPTVLSLSGSDWVSLTSKSFHLNIVCRFLYDQCYKNLCCGKFLSSNFQFNRNNLRLIYVSQSLNSGKEELRPALLNKWRCYLSSRIIVENGYYNIMSPVTLTDFYDYRLIETKFKTFGCISQSVEIKLANIKAEQGEVMVRGYTIGKTTILMDGKQIEENKSVMKKTDGFMPLTNVIGRFGNDGCLYV